MKKLIYSALVLFLFTGIYAQEPDASVARLKKGDVERFINHFNNIESDFEKIDVKYNPESDLKSFSESLDNIDEVNSIVKKYGYKDIESFVTQVWVITIAYANIKIDSDGSDEYKKAIHDIQNSTELTEEQKAVAIERLQQVMGAMESTFSAMVNEKDIETVRPFRIQLEKILDKD